MNNALEKVELLRKQATRSQTPCCRTPTGSRSTGSRQSNAAHGNVRNLRFKVTVCPTASFTRKCAKFGHYIHRMAAEQHRDRFIGHSHHHHRRILYPPPAGSLNRSCFKQHVAAFSHGCRIAALADRQITPTRTLERSDASGPGSPQNPSAIGQRILILPSIARFHIPPNHRSDVCGCNILGSGRAPSPQRLRQSVQVGTVEPSDGKTWAIRLIFLNNRCHEAIRITSCAASTPPRVRGGSERRGIGAFRQDIRLPMTA